MQSQRNTIMERQKPSGLDRKERVYLKPLMNNHQLDTRIYREPFDGLTERVKDDKFF